MDIPMLQNNVKTKFNTDIRMTFSSVKNNNIVNEIQSQLYHLAIYVIILIK